MQAFIFAISIIIWITLGIAVLFRVRMERALPVSVMAIIFLTFCTMSHLAYGFEPGGNSVDGDVVGKQLYKVDEKTRRLQYVDLSISE